MLTPLLGFDTETTGVKVRADRIVTASLVWRGNDRDEDRVHTWLISPDIDIPPYATAIHGITTQYARANGVEAKVALEEIAAELADALSSGVPVVAYNAPFDLDILDAELVRNGLDTLPDRINRSEPMPIIDPLVVDRAVDRFRKGKRTLESACAAYGVNVEADALHDSTNDVRATLDLWGFIVAKYPQLEQMEREELHAWQKAQHEAWATEFAEWMKKQGRPAHISTRWP